MRDISDAGPGSPASAFGASVGTSATLLLVDTIISGVTAKICEILVGPTVGANCSYRAKL